jgi:hypothetical protein
MLCYVQASTEVDGIAQRYSTVLRAGWLGVRVPAGAGNFSLYHSVQTGSGPPLASYQMGTGGSFPGVNWPGREADLSPPSSAEVKNAWNYSSTPPIRLHVMVLSCKKSTGATLLYFTLLYFHFTSLHFLHLQKEFKLSIPQHFMGC